MKKIFNVIIGVIGSVIILIMVYFILSIIFSRVNTLNPNVVASIIAALSAVIGIVYNQIKTQKREIAETHRLKKVDLYKNFMELMFDVLYKTKQGKFDKTIDKLPKEVEKMFMTFHKDLITWGSSDVIQKYVLFRNYSSNADSKYLLVLVDELLLAIRKDLGQSNLKLKKGDLLKIFINDPDEIDKLIKNAT